MRQPVGPSAYALVGGLGLGLGPGGTAPSLGPVISISSPATEPARVAMLDAGTEQDAAFLAAATDHAKSVQLQLQVVPIDHAGPLARAITTGKETGTIGVFWLGRRDDGLTIYLYDPRDQGVYVRELLRAEGESDAALVESVGLIIASTAVALRERTELGMRKADEQELAAMQPPQSEPEAEPEPETESEPEPTNPTPKEVSEEGDRSPSRAPTPAHPQLRLGAAYLGESFNRAAPWQSGVRGQLSLVIHPRIRLGLEYGFLAPARASRRPSLELTRHQLSASLGVGGSVSPRITLHGVIVGLANLVRWRGPLGTGLRTLVSVSPMAELGITLVRGLALDVGLGMAVPLNRFAFVVCEDEGGPCTGTNREVAARAWPVAPRAAAGLSYTFQRRAPRSR